MDETVPVTLEINFFKVANGMNLFILTMNIEVFIHY